MTIAVEVNILEADKKIKVSYIERDLNGQVLKCTQRTFGGYGNGGIFYVHALRDILVEEIPGDESPAVEAKG